MFWFDRSLFFVGPWRLTLAKVSVPYLPRCSQMMACGPEVLLGYQGPMVKSSSMTIFLSSSACATGMFMTRTSLVRVTASWVPGALKTMVPAGDGLGVGSGGGEPAGPVRVEAPEAEVPAKEIRPWAWSMMV